MDKSFSWCFILRGWHICTAAWPFLSVFVQNFMTIQRAKSLLCLEAGDIMLASELKEGSAEWSCAIHMEEADRKRLSETGISAGTSIIFRGTLLWRDPLLFETRDAMLALRRKDARRIEVERDGALYGGASWQSQCGQERLDQPACACGLQGGELARRHHRKERGARRRSGQLLSLHRSSGRVFAQRG